MGTGYFLIILYKKKNMTQDNSIRTVKINAINKNLAIANAAMQLQLPPPWTQYWMENRYNDAINVAKTDFCTWTVMINFATIREIQRKKGK